MTAMKLSIIIPAYDEEERIGLMLDAYLPYFTELYGQDVEFIVVINGSTDHTENIVNKYSEQNPCLKYIVEPERIGKGGALIRGFSRACGNLVGFVDADGSTPPEAFQDLADNIGDAGAIIASRWRRDAKVKPKQSLLRRTASRVFNLLTRMLFGLRITDTQCGAKLMRREAIMQVLPRLGITRWAFDVDLLFQLKRAGNRIIEIPTTWHDVSGSKIEIVRVSFEMFAALVRLRLLYSPFSRLVALYDKFIGPFIHPPGLEHDHLFRHSLVLLTGSQVTNVFNLLFQVAMMWMLSKSDYGDMLTMLRVFMIITFSMGAFSWTLTHFTARFVKDGLVEKVKPMMVGILRDLSFVGLLFLVVLICGVRELSVFLKLENPMLISIMSIALVAGLYIPVLTGVLNGCQAFFWLSGIAIIWSFARLILAVVFTAIGYSAVGAVSAHTLAAVISLILYVIALRFVLGRGIPRVQRIPGVYSYFFKYMIALAGFAVLMNADVILVKHYFSSAEAGLFGKAATVASVVIFLPLPISMAMFPKVVSSGGTSYENWRTLLKAFVLVSFISVIAALICTIFPQFFLRVLAGHRSPDLVPVVRGMAWALCPLSMTFVLMNFELAQHRFRVAVPLVFCALVYVAGVIVWHNTLLQVVSVLAVSSTLAMVLSMFVCRLEGNR